ncbi:MAG TPA: hypothetical protein VM599_05910 [Thermoanaerobaculia bacterium]|nr:hypothetical protein [Thermoanaerobaculia bacterium]
MPRFLVLALPLVLLALGAFHFAAEALDLAVPELPAPYLLGLWVLEAIGLVALFLLVRERGLGRWAAGLAASSTAWIFRGPVLALSAAGASRLPAGSWSTLVLAWLGLYSVCGLLMAAVAGHLERAESDLAAAPAAGLAGVAPAAGPIGPETEPAVPEAAPAEAEPWPLAPDVEPGAPEPGPAEPAPRPAGGE